MIKYFPGILLIIFFTFLVSFTVGCSNYGGLENNKKYYLVPYSDTQYVLRDDYYKCVLKIKDEFAGEVKEIKLNIVFVRFLLFDDIDKPYIVYDPKVGKYNLNLPRDTILPVFGVGTSNGSFDNGMSRIQKQQLDMGSW